MNALPLLLSAFMVFAPVFLAGVLAIPLAAFATDEEAVDIPAEVARLRQELLAVNLREGWCLEVARAQGTYSTSSGSSSYQSGSASTFDSTSRTYTSRYGSLGSSRLRERESTGSSTYNSAGTGSSDSTYSSSYSTPTIRAADCREEAKGDRDALVAYMVLATTSPKTFVDTVREWRVRKRAMTAQWVALFEQSRPAMRRDLDALAEAPPHKVGLEAFDGHLESLEQRLMSLRRTAPLGDEHLRTLQTVDKAIHAFGVARDIWRRGEGHADQVTLLEDALQVARERLARSPAPLVVQAEVDVHEQNLRSARSRVERATKESEAAWRNALSVANAALSVLGK